MALRDLLVKFGIDVEGGKKLDDVDAKVKKTLSGMERLGKSIQRLGYYMVAGFLARGIKNLVAGQFEAAVAAKYQAEALGISTEELQKYQVAADRMHVPVQQVAIAFRYFNRTIGEAALGTKSANKTFASLGIQVKDQQGNIRPTADILSDFSDKLKKVPSQALRTAYAMRTLGRGGAAMLPVLEKGGEALRDVFKDIDELGGGFTDKFIQQAADLDVQLKRVRFGWRSMYVAIATEIIPVLRLWTEHSIRTVKTLIDFAHHTYGVRTALMALSSGATVYAITRLLRLFNPFKMSIQQLLMTLLQNAPLVAFVALITAAYLILDDLYTFMKGGDSVIGRFLDQIGGKGTALKFWHELKDAFDQISAAVSPIIPQLEGIAKGIFQAFVNSVPFLVKWGGSIMTFVVAAIDTAITYITEFAKVLGGVIKAGWNYAHGDFDKGDKSLDAAFLSAGDTDKAYEKRGEAYKAAIDAFQSIGKPNSTGPMGSNADLVSSPTFQRPGAGGGDAPQKINVNVTQHINGAKDPAAVGREATRGVGKAVKDGLAQNRDAYAGVGVGMPMATGAD